MASGGRRREIKKTKGRACSRFPPAGHAAPAEGGRGLHVLEVTGESPRPATQFQRLAQPGAHSRSASSASGAVRDPRSRLLHIETFQRMR